MLGRAPATGGRERDLAVSESETDDVARAVYSAVVHPTDAPMSASALAAACSIDDLREMARRHLPRAVFDFFDGGAEDERCLAGNRQAFERLRLMPRALVDVSAVTTDCELLGGPASMPLAVAPTGALGFGRPDADLAVARAAARAGVPFTLSTTATTSIERVAREAPGRLWFQAYGVPDRDHFDALVARALAADYEALMITVDLPVGGKRERDLRNRFSIPFRPSLRTVLDFARHPRWLAGLVRHGLPALENLAGMRRPAAATGSALSSVGRNHDASFDWERLARTRDRWPRRLVVKGVAHGDDAARLVALGVDAVVVSNHGGRQLDAAPATLDALPAVLAAVNGRVPVLVDGGVRRGADLVRARALGAQAVLVGRATAFAACAGGQAGAARALEILRDELVRTMQLCGVCTVSAIGPGVLA